MKLGVGESRSMSEKAKVFGLVLLIFAAFEANAADVSVHAIVTNPGDFNHQPVTVRGLIEGLKETTSRLGNDYTTFRLHDLNSSEALNIFTWGHPALANSEAVQVQGVFEVEHHQGSYTFYNELEATSVAPLSN
jgi:hypothetical protein